MKKQVYLIPNAITAFGLACGLFVIFKVNMVEPGAGNYHVLFVSILILLLAAVADFLDGAVARIFRAESEFGFVFDSLSDAISFGVAPSVLFLKSLPTEQGSGLSFFALVGAIIYSICGVLRLVRFNVRASQVKGNKEEEAAQKKNFTGVPIPAAAIAAVALNLFLASPFAVSWFGWTEDVRAITLACAMIMLGFLMVCRWKFPSLKALHFRVPSFGLVLMTVIGGIFLIYGVLHFFAVMLLGLTWGYILLGLTLSLIRLIAGKRSKTLQDFEPEEEDAE
ncbi:MAG: CDP-alcohol phosphatidyltransferase family protein [Rhabdochlamydiaceae bacterium]|jgi:CDP-diacylglycerol--serine O-phosphatidyltransferase